MPKIVQKKAKKNAKWDIFKGAENCRATKYATLNRKNRWICARNETDLRAKKNAAQLIPSQKYMFSQKYILFGYFKGYNGQRADTFWNPIKNHMFFKKKRKCHKKIKLSLFTRKNVITSRICIDEFWLLILKTS